MKIRTITAVLALLLMSRMAVSAQKTRIAPEKEKAIRQLLAITETAKLMEQSFNQNIDAMRKSGVSVPAEFWDKMKQRMKGSELLNLLLPIYDKHYTLQDVNGLIAFYHTPLGKKMIVSTPLIASESMAVGQAWGRKIGEQVQREMTKPKK